MNKSHTKIAGILLLLLFTISACSGQADPTATPQPQETAEPLSPTQPPPTTAPPTEAPALDSAPTVVAPRDDQPVEPDPEQLQSPLETMEHQPDSRLTGITWEWVARDPNGNDVAPISVPSPENYTIVFNEDGTLDATIDCNDASGQYATPEPGRIFMQLGPMTLAACPEGSLETDMTNMFGPVQNYRISEDGSRLTLVWVAGGPIDTFRDASVELPGESEIEGVSSEAIELNTGNLASSYQWEVMPGYPIPTGRGGSGLPVHIVLTFDEQTIEDVRANNSAIIYIFPVEAYIAMYNAAGSSIVADQVTRLQSLIDTAAERSGLPESPMPLLPPPNSFMGRWAQFADLNFSAGSGVRYVSEAPNRQGIGPWTNLGTAYYYQGLTEDGRFYISMRWPVATAALPNTPDDVSPEVLAASTDPDTYPAYLQETKDSLNALSVSDWSPNLADIDALVSSLTFNTTPAEDSAEDQESTDEEVNLPDPQQGTPSGTITAEDGVFIRTGPGTEYPSVGTIPFDETGEIVGVSQDGAWWVFDLPPSLNAPNNQGWVSADFVDAQNAGSVPVIETPEVQPDLTGITWGWVAFNSPTGVTTQPDPALYTIQFNQDGQAAIKADCNNVSASYTSDAGSIDITLGASTLAACGPESLDQQFLEYLSFAAVYFFQQEDLFMDLFADGGTMRFTAQSGSGEVPPADDSPAAGDNILRVASFGPEGAQQQPLPGTTLTALFGDTQVSGSAGCNDYSANLIPVDDHFTVGPIATTQRLCSDPDGIMQQEQAYLAALGAVNGFQWVSRQVDGVEVITAGQLFYTTAGDQPGVINYTSP